MDEEKQFFVLDIGTRSVIGLIIHLTDGHYRCIDYLVKEHQDRAMMDGQIHNIGAVAETVIKIKEYFVNKHGPLQKVHIAAAGRSLKTERILVSENIYGKPPLNENSVQQLAWKALQKAQSMLNEIEPNYTFIGYTPLYYFIDRQPIGSLLHQQGEIASLEIIATYLPKIVITSLEATLRKAWLDMDGLTLEPIACVQTLIPPTLRHLNIAVVDIGAGTSDIAITNEGTIIAYGMIPQAGDEMTEVIQQLTLTDFQEAERIKRQLTTEKSFTVETLNTTQQLITTADLLKRLYPHIEKLAHSLTAKIKQLNNGHTPIAVLLIGGGSLTPYLEEMIAQQLGLTSQQVMLRTLNSLKQFSFPKEIGDHPMFITPFSIAYAANEMPLRFIYVSINGKTERLIQLEQLTIKDVLLSSSSLAKEWHGKSGEPKVITINQQQLTIPGSNGMPPYIFLNGKRAKLNDVVQSYDRIDIEKGIDGQPAEIRVCDCVGEIEEKSIYIHDAKYAVMPMVKVNQMPATTQQLLENGDHIEYDTPSTILEIFHSLDLAHLLEQGKPFDLTINGKYTIIPPHSGRIICNGEPVSLNSSIRHLDRLEVIEQIPLTLEKLMEYHSLHDNATITITVNKKEVTLSKQLLQIKRGNEQLAGKSQIYPGDTLSIIEQKEIKFYFHDALTFVHIPRSFQGATKYTLFKNGEKSSLSAEIHESDKLEVRWSTKHPHKAIQNGEVASADYAP